MFSLTFDSGFNWNLNFGDVPEIELPICYSIPVIINVDVANSIWFCAVLLKHHFSMLHLTLNREMIIEKILVMKIMQETSKFCPKTHLTLKRVAKYNLTIKQSRAIVVVGVASVSYSSCFMITTSSEKSYDWGIKCSHSIYRNFCCLLFLLHDYLKQKI